MNASPAVLDIRIYRIREGRGHDFGALARDETLPLARRHSHRIVASGPSLHDDHVYVLVRVFSDLGERGAALDRLYGSEEWLSDFEPRVAACLESYQTAVVETPGGVVEAWETSSPLP